MTTLGFRGEHEDRRSGIDRVLNELERVYRHDARSIAGFLDTPHPMLDGRTPADLARSSPTGADAVLRLLERAEAGMPV